MDTPVVVAAKRAEHLERVRRAYDAEAEHPKGRWALLSRSERGFGHYIAVCATLERAKNVAADDVLSGWEPVCLFDLDHLEGPEPPLEPGDTVELPEHAQRSSPAEDGHLHVVTVIRGAVDSRQFAGLGSAAGSDVVERWEHPTNLVVRERATPDERLPRRHAVEVRVEVTVDVDRDPSEQPGPDA